MQTRVPDGERRRGRYTLLGQIASGGMATVHFGRLAGEGGFSRIVAVKCMHAHLAADPDFRAMFLDEARLAARIQHPNVVATIDLGQSDEGMFLVTEYVTGESLTALTRAAVARGERVPVDISIRILIDTLNGLHAAHIATDDSGAALCIVHRDVSPQNILVSTDGLARVLDFGIAKAAGRSHTTRDGQLKGKLHYMAPEQFRDAPVSAQTDVYAASVVLWELLTGERLFAGSNDAAIMARVLEGVVVPPSKLTADVPPELDAIVLRGLARDPAERFASASEMAEVLEGLHRATAGRQLGAWVEHLAGDVLRKRADLIAKIDRTGASAVPVGSIGAPRAPLVTMTDAAQASPPLSTPPVLTGTLDLGTPIMDARVLDRTRVLDAARSSGFPPPPLADGPPTAQPRVSGRALPILFIASAAVLIAGFVLLRGRGTAQPTTASPIANESATTVDSTANRSEPSMSAMPSAAAPSLARSEPSASAGTNEDDPAIAASTSSGKVTPSKAPSRPRRNPARPAGTSTAPNCNPPYYEDATGIRRVKPQCL